MKKRIVSFVLATMLGSFSCMHILNVQAEENVTEPENVGRGTLLYETDMVTRKDFEEGFQNYAQSGATVDFAADRNVYSVNEPANVVGAVRDYETEEMISGATISVDGEILVTTGADGRFQIRNFPSGVYDWQINASGYFTAEYSNYDVDYLDGATIFTFYISDDFAVQKDRAEILYGDACEQQQELFHARMDGEDGIVPTAAVTMTAPPEINSQIRVYYNGEIHTVGREEYIYTVLSSEVYGASYYESRGLTLAQRVAFYEAQAIVANTFAEYSISVSPKHPGSGYDVCSNSSSCQAYDPSKVTQQAISCTTNIFYYNGKDVCDMVMYKPTSTTYEYAMTEFFSGCNNEGTWDVAGRPYSNRVDCTDLVTKNAGHHRGMCQMGAAQRAKNGESAYEIISYYFTNVKVVPCPLN